MGRIFKAAPPSPPTGQPMLSKEENHKLARGRAPNVFVGA